MIRIVYKVLLCSLLFPSLSIADGKFPPDEYKRALWMTTRFYGGQRSGKGPNWLLMEHPVEEYRTSFTNDGDGSVDLEGGWFDCGDHVTFGQTFFFSAYLLAKAYDLFPTGFYDNYCGFDYADYRASKNWDMEGGQGDGIPDILQELKYATDWMIKATPNGSTFYYQKGEGAKDHKTWVTAGKMSTQPVDDGGEPRKMYKNPNDGVMAAMATGALAIMSRVYEKFDPAYAALCLEHAKNAYSYAKSKKGQSAGAGDGSFYGGHSQPAEMAFITAASEMYAVTGEASYKSAALADQEKIRFHNWGFDYANTHDLAPLAMATTGVDEEKLGLLKTMFVDTYTKSLNGEGVCTKGNSGWGALRYPGNHAFIVAAWSQAKDDRSVDDFVYKQVDYIMGANNAKQSFIVGFCSGCAKQVRLPHHRNVFLNDDNPKDEEKGNLTIPARNEQFGYLVGGTWNSSSYKETVTDYAMTEGGIDYNAGLVGALGYIVSIVAPADTANMVSVFRKRSGGYRQHATAPFSVVNGTAGWHISIADGRTLSRVAVIDSRGRVVTSVALNASVCVLPHRAAGSGVFTVVAYGKSGERYVARIVGGA